MTLVPIPGVTHELVVEDASIGLNLGLMSMKDENGPTLARSFQATMAQKFATGQMAESDLTGAQHNAQDDWSLGQGQWNREESARGVRMAARLYLIDLNDRGLPRAVVAPAAITDSAKAGSNGAGTDTNARAFFAQWNNKATNNVRAGVKRYLFIAFQNVIWYTATPYNNDGAPTWDGFKTFTLTAGNQITSITPIDNEAIYFGYGQDGFVYFDGTTFSALLNAAGNISATWDADLLWGNRIASGSQLGTIPNTSITPSTKYATITANAVQPNIGQINAFFALKGVEYVIGERGLFSLSAGRTLMAFPSDLSTGRLLYTTDASAFFNVGPSAIYEFDGTTLTPWRQPFLEQKPLMVGGLPALYDLVAVSAAGRRLCLLNRNSSTNSQIYTFDGQAWTELYQGTTANNLTVGIGSFASDPSLYEVRQGNSATDHAVYVTLLQPLDTTRDRADAARVEESWRYMGLPNVDKLVVRIRIKCATPGTSTITGAYYIDGRTDPTGVTTNAAATFTVPAGYDETQEYNTELFNIRPHKKGRLILTLNRDGTTKTNCPQVIETDLLYVAAPPSRLVWSGQFETNCEGNTIQGRMGSYFMSRGDLLMLATGRRIYNVGELPFCVVYSYDSSIPVISVAGGPLDDPTGALAIDLSQLATSTEWLMFGAEMEFSRIICYATGNTTAGITWRVQYFSQEANDWVTINGVTDTTVTAGHSMAQTGHLAWARPRDWIVTTSNFGNDRMWYVRIQPVGGVPSVNARLNAAYPAVPCVVTLAGPEHFKDLADKIAYSATLPGDTRPYIQEPTHPYASIVPLAFYEI